MKCLVLFLIFSSMLAFCQENYGDKTLSPYFFVKSNEPELDQMPLKKTDVYVKIAGFIADVTVKQIYKNEGKKPLEAIYVFPGSTRAAVYGMKMKIGERTILAKIKQREEARKIYEKARQEGRTASLLEQQRPNVFQMNVANIMPQDLIEVELKYTETLLFKEKIYEFVFPTVVGPRYSNISEKNAPSSERWIKSPYFFEKEKPNYTFNINITISAGLPIYSVSSPSHKINVNFESLETAKVSLDDSEKYGGNRDFILRYKLSGKEIKEGLLLYENGKENFFLLMVQPPEKLPQNMLPDREYIFIVDVSGSMYGYPLEISKKIIKEILMALKPSDKFNILLFSGSSYVLSERSLNATEENIKNAISIIDSQKGGGGTEILPALKRALSLPRDENLSTTILVLTDGYVRVEREVFQVIRENLNKANLFSFGIGTSVNRFIIEGMARAGMAESFIAIKPEEAIEVAEEFKKVVSSPALTDIKVEFLGFDAYDVEPVSIPDLFLEKPLYIFGKYKGKPEGIIEVKGINGNGVFKKIINVYEEKPSKANSALPFLWARSKIATLSDYETLDKNEENKDKIIELGLKYNLLTKYTSFIAEDSLLRNKEGISETVNQPLPLPEGVSNYAIAGLPCEVPKSAPLVKMEAMPLADYVVPYVVSKELKMEKEKVKPLKDKQKIQLKIISVSNKNLEQKVKDIILQNLKLIESCSLKGFVGRINIKIILEEGGKIRDTILKGNQMKKEVKNCIIERIKKWNFQTLKNLNLLEIDLILEVYV